MYSMDVVRRATRAAGRVLGLTLVRTLAATGISATVFFTSGCYSFLPQNVSEVRPNTIVAVDISDVGRVALADRVGQEVAVLEGKVQARDTAIHMLVSKVRYLNGLENEWQGQVVSLRPEDLKKVTLRTFSKRRTALMIGAAAAGLVISILTLDFLGITSGDPTRDKPVDPDPPES